MANRRKRFSSMYGPDVTVEYNPALPEFGVFLDVVDSDTGASLALAEIEPKKARKLAKAILKITKRK